MSTDAPLDKSLSCYVHIPSTVSRKAAAALRLFPNPHLIPAVPKPDDIKGWSLAQKGMEDFNIAQQKPLIDFLQPVVSEKLFDGVPILEVKPKAWQGNGKLLVYLHGGAYTLFSAKSSLANAALMAEATGLKVLSIDYTLAPHAKWQQITDEVITVFSALAAQGILLQDIAIAGDSAGGSLSASSVLKMRDLGMGMPAAVVLWSPWSDITNTGDSYETLKQAEPMYTYENFLKPSAEAYADIEDQKNPYVSPVYGDYSKGFPPTLIQGGTKEIFLSNFVRHYQAIDTAGLTVKLDLYEGMTHVFQSMMAGSDESNIALGKVDEFLKLHLM